VPEERARDILILYCTAHFFKKTSLDSGDLFEKSEMNWRIKEKTWQWEEKERQRL